MTYKQTLLLLILSVMLNLAASARTAKILYFKAPANAPKETYIYQDDNAPLISPLPKNNFSKTIKLKEGDIKLYFLPEALAPGLKEFPKDTPYVNIPSSWNKVLILASKDPRNKLFPVNFYAINANSDRLNLGDVMFVNSSNSKVFGFVGNKKIAIRPNEIKVIKNPAKPLAEYKVELKRVVRKSNKAVLFYRKISRQSANQSSLVLFYNLANSERLTYYCAPIRGL